MLKNVESIEANQIQISEEKISKDQLLKMIADATAKRTKNKPEKILEALQAREKVGSTGFEKGIAIPHCQLDSIEKFTTGLIICKKGVDFEAMDGKKSYIFFYIVGPLGERQHHIQILSSASRLLAAKGVVNKLKKATSPVDAQQALLQTALHDEMNIAQQERMLFQIAISTDQLFDEILQAAVAQDIESITILEGDSAATYLYHIPLFASFWSDQNKNSRKVILASVDKKLANNLIRQIYMIPEIDQMEDQFQLNVINLYFSSGKLGL